MTRTDSESKQAGFSSRALIIKRRCSACRAPRQSDGAYCFNCGASLRRKTPFVILPLLLLAGLVFSLPEDAPMTTVEHKRFDPHRRTFERSRKLPPRAGSPAAELARVEDLLGREGGGRAHVLAAVDLLDGLIDKYPGYDYARRLKGNLLAQAQRHQSAAEALSAYLANQPTDMNARITLARQLMALERWEEAMVQLDRVGDAHPRYSLVPELTARIQDARGRQQEAEHSRQRANELKQAHGVQKPSIVYLPRLPE